MILGAWTQPAGLRHARARAVAPACAIPTCSWRLAHEKPWFNNQVAWLELDGRRATFVLEKALPPEDGKGEPEHGTSLRALDRTQRRLREGLRHTLRAGVMIR